MKTPRMDMQEYSNGKEEDQTPTGKLKKKTT